MRDVFSEAINSTAGRLAEIVVKKLPKNDSEDELSDGMRGRLDQLVDAPGRPGKLARTFLAAEVSYLFERAPEWVKRKIIPLFDWSSPDSSDAWAARKYSNYIGSPELFGLVKKPFLEIFSRNDIPSEDMRTFADWLCAILIANEHRTENRYPLKASEARAALRRAGSETLSSAGHRLAMEMEGAKSEEKVNCWRTIVGPVLKAIWPLDVELQSHASTFKLVQILKATGDAFPEAADLIIPLIRPDDTRSHTIIYSISEISDALYASAPEKMLDLIAAVVGEASAGSVFALGKALKKIQVAAPHLLSTRKYQKLSVLAAAD
ncbi:hypothetical protein [Tardiphaga sp. P9-11]|jgi:hypothetical protein|uniref:hypothetical protein n=1 Tax=Tardiphaga sp. P9-11 TaxID=2024614 RepID=UPI0011F3F9F4|nr:hypothetical protein [Tardiphaga sp. P9-11]KAA0076567.1 hypothetical protein CIW50_10250 [Tardiphaga sp. P9-11]